MAEGAVAVANDVTAEKDVLHFGERSEGWATSWICSETLLFVIAMKVITSHGKCQLKWCVCVCVCLCVYVCMQCNREASEI